MADRDKGTEKKAHEAYQKLGHLGGEATSETHGPEFYENIGHKGGEATSESHGHEFYEDIGEKGGEARKRQMAEGEVFSKDNPQKPSKR